MLLNMFRRLKVELNRSVEVNGGAREMEQKRFNWKINNFHKILMSADLSLIEKQKFNFGAGSGEGQLCEWEVSLTGPTEKDPNTKRRWVGVNFRLKNNLSDCNEAIANMKMTIFASNDIFWQVETGAMDMTRKKYCEFPKVICLEDGAIGTLPPCLSKDGSLEIHLKFTLYSGIPIARSETCRRFSEMKLLQKLRDDFQTIRLEENNCDVRIICRDRKELYAHKFILSARSLMFRNMFNSGMKEDLEGVVKVKDISSDTMELLLHYIYTGSLPPSWIKLDHVGKQNLFRAADKYQLVELTQFLEDDDLSSISCPSFTSASSSSDLSKW